MTRHRRRYLALALLTLVAAGAVGQDEPPPAEPAAGDIDRILAAEEEMLTGEETSYDPGNRRDPFKSLLARRPQNRFRGPRPEGIPGLLIDEIDLTGIFITSSGPAAQILAADRNESYLLREGDELYDGDVTRIELDQIVFRQIVDDPSAIKPFREVVKQLNP